MYMCDQNINTTANDAAGDKKNDRLTIAKHYLFQYCQLQQNMQLIL